MTKRNFLITVFLSFLFVVSSCSIDDDGKNPSEILSGAIDSSKVEVVVSQTEKNSSNLSLSIKNAVNAGKATLNAYAVNGEKRYLTFSKSFDLDSGKAESSFDAGTFGKYTLEVVFSNADTETIYSVSEPLKIVADEYNVAIQNATFPVLLMTLESLNEENPAPTFVALERNLAYNWNNLPSFLHSTPTVNPETLTSTSSFHSDAVPGTIEFVKQLKEISPESKINLFVTDNYPELILKVLYMNGCTEENSSAIMYSDGSGTYYLEQKALSGTSDESLAKYADLKKEWEDAKSKALQQDSTYLDSLIEKYGGAQILQMHAAVIASEEENIEWHVGRKDLLKSENSDLQAKIQAAATQVNMGNLLNSLDDEKKSSLKNLYNFDSEMFSAAEENGKKAMMFIGTKNDATSENYHLSAYLTFMKNFYGSGYEYYYKGHPADPSMKGTVRAELLESLGMYELDASIPAELILFFNPSVYCCGYTSTTFESVDDEHTLTIMNTSSVNDSVSYKSRIKSYIYMSSGNFRIDFTDSALPYSYCLWSESEPQKFTYYDSSDNEVTVGE